MVNGESQFRFDKDASIGVCLCRFPGWAQRCATGSGRCSRGDWRSRHLTVLRTDMPDAKRQLNFARTATHDKMSIMSSVGERLEQGQSLDRGDGKGWRGTGRGNGHFPVPQQLLD